MGGTITPDDLESLLKTKDRPLVLDVRRAADKQSDPATLPGAAWKDPEKASEWGKDLANQDVVIYCVRGGSVSKSVQEKLLSLKVNVKYVEGGLEAWKKAGKEVMK
ncbi:MAG: rhodanese-like domain-containing protein [Nitrospiraceae bacterium]|nr:rhodanese-like domain-containing protein [Nitrospiraceae bacterium]